MCLTTVFVKAVFLKVIFFFFLKINQKLLWCLMQWCVSGATEMLVRVCVEPCPCAQSGWSRGVDVQ